MQLEPRSKAKCLYELVLESIISIQTGKYSAQRHCVRMMTERKIDHSAPPFEHQVQEYLRNTSEVMGSDNPQMSLVTLVHNSYSVPIFYLKVGGRYLKM